jgi:hypothetical protein
MVCFNKGSSTRLMLSLAGAAAVRWIVAWISPFADRRDAAPSPLPDQTDRL